MESIKAFTIPLALVRQIGVTEAFLLCYLVCKLDSPPSFTNVLSVEEIANETGINAYTQRKILAALSEKGYIKVNREGNTPPKRRIDILKIPNELLRHVAAY